MAVVWNTTFDSGRYFDYGTTTTIVGYGTSYWPLTGALADTTADMYSATLDDIYFYGENSNGSGYIRMQFDGTHTGGWTHVKIGPTIFEYTDFTRTASMGKTTFQYAYNHKTSDQPFPFPSFSSSGFTGRTRLTFYDSDPAIPADDTNSGSIGSYEWRETDYYVGQTLETRLDVRWNSVLVFTDLTYTGVSSVYGSDGFVYAKGSQFATTTNTIYYGLTRGNSVLEPPHYGVEIRNISNNRVWTNEERHMVVCAAGYVYVNSGGNTTVSADEVDTVSIMFLDTDNDNAPYAITSSNLTTTSFRLNNGSLDGQWIGYTAFRRP